jgi:transposase
MQHYTQKDVDTIIDKFKSIKDSLNEKQRRLWCASEAIAFGYGGLSLVCAATGLSSNTVRKAITEIKNGDVSAQVQIRCSGGGRKKATEKQRGLRKALKMLVESETKGDPETPLLWTSKSTRHLCDELRKRGYKISHSTVSTLLQKYGYSLQVIQPLWTKVHRLPDD